MSLSQEQREQLNEFDVYIRNAAEGVRLLMNISDGPVDVLKLGFAIGQMSERIEKRERFCCNDYKLQVW